MATEAESDLATTGTEEDKNNFRRPTQARGIAKFEKILDTVHELIENRGIDNFSLYDVADAAGVATGSVYHFFPSLQAAFVALVERYDQEFADIIAAPVDASLVNDWEDILFHHTERSRAYLNQNAPALNLLLGPGQSWRSRLVDTEGNMVIAQSMLESYRQLYIVPSVPDPAELLLFAIEILEALWGLSYQRHRMITDDMAEETRKAMVAYLRLYFPKHMAPAEQPV
ncbi:TetR/AcrR family transcriptional regulator [Pseudomaricurvus alkylphenolicus]|jgi:AcrR family transcriptional regulator|uniref:TetR/AcrR family transcriptional regulator n=1 Tax=Pseudomaricurvus alkylphenolicus TaxID=1306991 RepID=UPI00141E7509|nr:TetR/AcrR family transcriptional regulator [Pseudomaricurvus alkylphenolicus]NIB44188.1 TetR/AcrR family transcriptional regulator [Pseudomaricurvus alkylphenolicus]